MKPIIIERTISAPAEKVFNTVAHITEFSKVIDSITNVEFVSEQQQGVGTRFKETRVMKGREATVELEVTEYQPNSRVRIRSDEGGTVWDTVFTVDGQEDGAKLTMSMEAHPHSFMAKLTTPLIRGMIASAIEADIDAVKRHCEG